MFGFTCWFIAVWDALTFDTFGIAIVFSFTCRFVAIRDAFAMNTFTITTAFVFALLLVAVRDALSINTFSVSVVFSFALVLITRRMTKAGSVPRNNLNVFNIQILIISFFPILKDILHELSFYHSSTKFTYELESNNKLAFSKMCVTRASNNEVERSICRKATNTSININLHCHANSNWKIGTPSKFFRAPP